MFLFYDVVQKGHLHTIAEAEIKSTFVVDLDWLKKRVGTAEESLDTLIEGWTIGNHGYRCIIKRITMEQLSTKIVLVLLSILLLVVVVLDYHHQSRPCSSC